MKGFIEVTIIGNGNFAYKLKHVKAFSSYKILLKNDEWVQVKESYEEIKQLIKNATNEN